MIKKILSNIGKKSKSAFAHQVGAKKKNKVLIDYCSLIRKNQKFIPKQTKSLKKTQNYYNETKSLKPIEIKEFSFLYILLKKPDLIRENYYLIENVKLFSNENKLIFEQILKETNNLEKTDFESINIDQNLIERILKYASIKHILEKNYNDDQKILEIYHIP